MLSKQRFGYHHSIYQPYISYQAYQVCGCRLTGFPTMNAMWRLIKVVFASAFTMARQGRSATSPFTLISGLRLKVRYATMFGCSSIFASKTTGSLLCRKLTNPGLGSRDCIIKRGYRAKWLTGGSSLVKTHPGPKSSFICFYVDWSTYLDQELRP